MRKRILVVDGFDSIRRYVCETLQRNGYDTLDVSNSREAFDMLLGGKVKIDLVLADYNLSESNGYELLKKIKSTPDISKVPVVFLTTENNPDVMRAAKEAGLSAWIKKPYRGDVFYSKIEEAISNV